MTSIILSSVVSFFKSIAAAFKESRIGTLLLRIYNGISLSWRKSVIITRFCKEDNDAKDSKTSRILRSPFAFLAKFGGFLEERVQRSIICAWSKTYIHNFMAVNTRFLGTMLFFASVSYAAHIFRTGRLSKIAILGMGVGFVLMLVNYNLMSFLNPSKFVGLVKNFAGFRDLKFSFFDESRTQIKNRRIALAAAVGIATGVAAQFNILYAAMIPFALFGVLLVMYAPVTGVYAAVFLAPFLPTMLLAGICIWTAMSLVIKSLSDKMFKWKFDGVGICAILLLGVLLVSSLASFARIGSVKVWLMYFVFIGFYFVVINTVKTKEQLFGLFKILVISGALVALYGIMQYAFGWTTSNAWIDEEMFEDATMRVYSTLGNPNVLGEYLLLILPFAAVYMLKYKWRELSKYGYGAMFVVLALCLVLTQSRGCWIGFAISVAVFVTFYEGRWWGLIPLALLILPFILPQTIIDRFLSIGNMEDSSTSYRVYIWLGTLGMMRHFWLGGIGMGEAAFSQVYPFFSYNAITAPHSHNLFLQLLVEAGISGLAVFLALQIVFLKNMSKVYRHREKKSTESMLALAAASGVIGFLVQSMFDYTFYNYRVMAVFFMIIALGMTLRHVTVKGVGKTQ